MTAPEQNQVTQEPKPSDKELNFRALEAKYQRELEQANQARMHAEKQAQELLSRKQEDLEEDDDAPYIDHKRLSKTLSAFERKMEERIDKKADEKARTLIDQNKRDSWLKSNPDFYEVYN